MHDYSWDSIPGLALATSTLVMDLKYTFQELVVLLHETKQL